jgi:hypothetical protein
MNVFAIPKWQEHVLMTSISFLPIGIGNNWEIRAKKCQETGILAEFRRNSVEFTNQAELKAESMVYAKGIRGSETRFVSRI